MPHEEEIAKAVIKKVHVLQSGDVVAELDTSLPPLGRARSVISSITASHFDDLVYAAARNVTAIPSKDETDTRIKSIETIFTGVINDVGIKTFMDALRAEAPDVFAEIKKPSFYVPQGATMFWANTAELQFLEIKTGYDVRVEGEHTLYYLKKGTVSAGYRGTPPTVKTLQVEDGDIMIETPRSIRIASRKKA